MAKKGFGGVASSRLPIPPSGQDETRIRGRVKEKLLAAGKKLALTKGYIKFLAIIRVFYMLAPVGVITIHSKRIKAAQSMRPHKN